jgi:hypothetical protein
MTLDEIKGLIEQCSFFDYTFLIDERGGAIRLKARYWDKDIVTGLEETQHTREWLLSRFLTKSQIVQTAFKCCLTSMEHRAREGFKYRGKRVYGPHFDVDQLWELCADKGFDYPQPGEPS